MRRSQLPQRRFVGRARRALAPHEQPASEVGRIDAERLADVAERERRVVAEAAEIDIASGPGKLCMAMSIDKGLNEANLSGRTLWVEDRNIEIERIETGPRIGVDYAGEYKDKPWRFHESGNPHVSRVRVNRHESRA